MHGCVDVSCGRTCARPRPRAVAWTFSGVRARAGLRGPFWTYARVYGRAAAHFMTHNLVRARFGWVRDSVVRDA